MDYRMTWGGAVIAEPTCRLGTASKSYTAAPPNFATSPTPHRIRSAGVCPDTLPVAESEGASRYALKRLALKSASGEHSEFDRKQIHIPTCPKNSQSLPRTRHQHDRRKRRARNGKWPKRKNTY